MLAKVEKLGIDPTENFKGHLSINEQSNKQILEKDYSRFPCFTLNYFELGKAVSGELGEMGSQYWAMLGVILPTPGLIENEHTHTF